MKLDRNINPKGHGKYALVNMRKLLKALDDPHTDDEVKQGEAFEFLVKRGIITLGNETPGDQFFVMKYKDKFTAPALKAYAASVQIEAQWLAHGKGDKAAGGSLMEYANQIGAEALKARELGNRIPD